MKLIKTNLNSLSICVKSEYTPHIKDNPEEYSYALLNADFLNSIRHFVSQNIFYASPTPLLQSVWIENFNRKSDNKLTLKAMSPAKLYWTLPCKELTKIRKR